MKFIVDLLRLFTPAQRRLYYMLQTFFVFAAVVQVAGVGSVAPFIAVLADPSRIHKNSLTKAAFDRGGFTSDTEFLIAFGIALMALIAFTNAVAAATMWYTMGFARRLGVDIQKDIYHGYLHRDYAELSRTHSGTLVATVTDYVGRFVYMVVQPFLYVVAQGFIVALVVIALVIYDPAVALVAALIVGAGYLMLFAYVRRKLEAHGNSALRMWSERQRILSESLRGIKEIRLLGTERMYQDRYDEVTRTGLRSDQVVALMGDFPRFVLETIAFVGLLSMGVYMLAVNESPEAVLGVLSLYAMAGYKVLPAAQSVFKSLAQIKANGSVMYDLTPDVLAGRAARNRRVGEERVTALPVADIKLHDVWYTYPTADAPTIRGVTATIPRNAITVIVGSSGAGKSTLADLLLGLLRPARGSIRVAGAAIGDNTTAWQRNLGYVPQRLFILDGSIAANISFGRADVIDREKVRRAATLANLDKFVDTLPDGYEYRVGEDGALLSGGQRQRIGIARALYHDAKVLVLDEATSALDSTTERGIINTLIELKRHKTVVMIAHRLATIRCADQVVFLKDGTLEDVGSYDELMGRSEEFRALVAASDHPHAVATT